MFYVIKCVHNSIDFYFVYRYF